MNPISILIADDHPLLRQGLKTVIEKDPGFLIAAETSDGELALQLIKQLQPVIAILDINMPSRDGLAVAREIQAERLATRIIFITVHADTDVFREAVRLGCRGYVLKDSSLVEILSALRAVRDGQFYFPPGMLAALGEKPATSLERAGTGGGQLTPSERRIMRLIAAGKSSKEIANELAIHYKTVENHRTNITQKLGVSGPHALVRFALQHKADW